MNVLGLDLLQPWNTQINIPPILETKHKLMYVSGENIIRYYKEQLLAIHVVQKQGTTAVVISKASIALSIN